MKLKARRRVIAGAITAVPVLLILGSFVAPGQRISGNTTAQAAGLLPTPTPTPTPCLLSPTPLPTIIPGIPTPPIWPLCPTPIPTPPPPPVTVPPVPVPTSLPPLPGITGSSPTPDPNNPGGVPPGSPPGTLPGAPPGAPGAPGGPAGPGALPGTTGFGGFTPSGGSVGGASSPQFWPDHLTGRLVVADPLLASWVDYILRNPVAAQRPDLLHFSVNSSTPVNFVLGGMFGTGSKGGGPPLLPATAGMLLVVGALTAVIVLVVRAPWRRRVTAAIVAPATLAIAIPATAAVLLSHSADSQATARAASQIGRPLTGLSAHAVQLAAPSEVATWSQLISIENALTAQHDKIVNDEQQIANVTTLLNQAPANAGGPHSLRPQWFLLLTNELRQLVNQHQTLLAAYDMSLQREYTFFRTAVQTPPQLTALEAAVTRTPSDVQQAVTYDIRLVQTQVSQEAAITGAVSQTPFIPSLQGVSGPISFHAPLSGVVSQPFGPTRLSLEPPVTYNGIFYPHFHTGLDIAAPMDSLVGASAPGTVLLATTSRDSNGNVVGYGNYVVIAHGNGFLTVYGHLDRILVVPGQQVTAGQVIGLVGSTGWSTGPHVHFEIRNNGIFVDPAPYIASQIRT